MSLRRALTDWFVLWYMGRVAGRYCPCEWPVKSKRLMHLCGRIDDAAERADFRRFGAFWLTQHTSSSASNVTFTLKRKRH